LIKKSSLNKKFFINVKKLRNIFYKNGLVGLHPSCTTKIALNKRNGVVDKNLKVFGYKNIYVVGSSVFPNNGYTNPTWTIMALALRLAKRLIKIS
jgi:choline dehydrogenase-like flavoprotein